MTFGEDAASCGAPSVHPVSDTLALSALPSSWQTPGETGALIVRIYILGAGTPTPTAERFGSSYVVTVGGENSAGEHVMFDCGPAATHKLVKAGLWPTQIDYLFFTHH